MLHIADCLGERNSQGEFKPEKEEETRFSEGKKTQSATGGERNLESKILKASERGFCKRKLDISCQVI